MIKNKKNKRGKSLFCYQNILNSSKEKNKQKDFLFFLNRNKSNQISM